MSDIESGKTKSPSAVNLLKIAAALNANPWRIVSGEGSPENMQGANEAAMLEAFRQLDEGQRRAILAAAKAMHATESLAKPA